ncbi:sigma-70 family RNA polymerase sigma factor [Nodularia spumigena]|uniref:sigma-70 family RNA polymerase sigma factor n=1 Tax=Nodularia spumigena TaxID=70799 RepID=UPI002B20ACCD|nr:sigma-70 family RNA polymerase sigma factor [Nodularia spumigena]MEA5557607.1 sigma-70 family RNA polymerase sigma factor [Nodularia spumigena CH309]
MPGNVQPGSEGKGEPDQGISESQRHEVTRLLHEMPGVEGDEARHLVQELLPLVYDDLRRLAQAKMNREPESATLEPTALAHETFMRLVDHSRVDWRGKSHFMAVAAQAMRRILVDHARARKRLKRGGARQRMELGSQVAQGGLTEVDLIELDDALEKLASVDPRQAKVVELRFFGGLSVEEAAESLGVSKRTVEGDWTMARAWLRRALSEGGEP